MVVHIITRSFLSLPVDYQHYGHIKILDTLHLIRNTCRKKQYIAQEH